MSTQTILIIIIIGLAAGCLSGLVGVGGGIISCAGTCLYPWV